MYIPFYYITLGSVRGMLEVKVSKGAFRHVEQELYDYHSIKREIIRLRNEILFAGPIQDESGIRGTDISNLTANKAIASATNIAILHMERVTAAIDSVVERLPQDKQKLVRLKYWTKPQVLTMAGIAQEINTSERTVYGWRDEVVYAIADKLGWR